MKPTKLLDKTTTLKPCPFCGGGAVYKDMEQGFPIPPTVVCSSCGVGFSREFESGYGNDICTDMVIRLWNNRV